MRMLVHILIATAMSGVIQAAPFPAGRPAEARAADATPPAADSSFVPPDTALVPVGSSAGANHAFVAWPASKSPAPVVIVAHEWWGLNAQIRTIAERLAREGYVAIVPDLYHGKVADDADRAHILSRGLDYAEADADIDSVLAWAEASPNVARGRTAMLGFCLGGGVALQYALHNPALSALVMFYGSPVTDSTQLAALHAPLMGHFGKLDEGITPAKVDAFRAALRKGGHAAEIFSYDGAGHAFMNDARPSYNKAAATQAWQRTRDFLKAHLQGS